MVLTVTLAVSGQADSAVVERPMPCQLPCGMQSSLLFLSASGKDVSYQDFCDRNKIERRDSHSIADVQAFLKDFGVPTTAVEIPTGNLIKLEEPFILFYVSQKPDERGAFGHFVFCKKSGADVIVYEPEIGEPRRADIVYFCSQLPRSWMIYAIKPSIGLFATWILSCVGLMFGMLFIYLCVLKIRQPFFRSVHDKLKAKLDRSFTIIVLLASSWMIGCNQDQQIRGLDRADAIQVVSETAATRDVVEKTPQAATGPEAQLIKLIRSPANFSPKLSSDEFAISFENSSGVTLTKENFSSNLPCCSVIVFHRITPNPVPPSEPFQAFFNVKIVSHLSTVFDWSLLCKVPSGESQTLSGKITVDGKSRQIYWIEKMVRATGNDADSSPNGPSIFASAKLMFRISNDMVFDEKLISVSGHSALKSIKAKSKDVELIKQLLITECRVPCVIEIDKKLIQYGRFEMKGLVSYDNVSSELIVFGTNDSEWYAGDHKQQVDLLRLGEKIVPPVVLIGSGPKVPVNIEKAVLDGLDAYDVKVVENDRISISWNKESESSAGSGTLRLWLKTDSSNKEVTFPVSIRTLKK